MDERVNKTEEGETIIITAEFHGHFEYRQEYLYTGIQGRLMFSVRFTSPSLIRIKFKKKIVPGRFLVTFGHLNILQKELNFFMVGKSRTWPPLISTAPFITKKKKSFHL